MKSERFSFCFRLIEEEINGKAMRLNLPLMVFSLQGDGVIGVSDFNSMAEEYIADQKVSLPLNINA